MVEPSNDPIEPVAIEHGIDEIWFEGRLQQYYNFFDCHFERDGAYCRARSYVDAMDKVVLHGPFAARGALRRVENADFERAVHAYLNRRYRTVEGW